jgi:hypothetical protein
MATKNDPKKVTGLPTTGKPATRRIVQGGGKVKPISAATYSQTTLALVASKQPPNPTLDGIRRESENYHV